MVTDGEPDPSASEPPRPPCSVLVVDDDDGMRTLVVRWLTTAGFSCVEASGGAAALQIARERAESIDAIVCDVMMPGMNGYDVISLLRGDERTASIPVILLTAHALADTDIVRGMDTGAVDHLAKPFSGPVLISKIRSACERARAERQLRSELRLAQLNSTIDPLTGLFNRRHFERRLDEEAAHAKRHRRPLSCAMVDLDHFKRINDTYGHAEGDRVLAFVASEIQRCLRPGDTAFRFGGEEFVVLLRDTDSKAAVIAIERLQRELKSRPVSLGGDLNVVTFSCGVAAADEANEFAVERLVARADEALYAAKRAGRGRVALAG